MFKQLKMDEKIGKKAYKEKIKNYELAIGEVQRKIKEAKIPVMIVFEGWDASGKGTLINNLILPLDPRGFKVYTIKDETEEEYYRPFLWRFWTKLPAKGRMVILDKSYYRKTIEERFQTKKISNKAELYYKEINQFEKMLTDDGMVILKFFVHITKEEQEKRFLKLSKNKSTAWRITDEDWNHHEHYQKLFNYAEETIHKTHTSYAPWHLIEGNNERVAHIKIMEKVLHSLNEALKLAGKEHKLLEEPSHLDFNYKTVLEDIDLSKAIDKDKYKEEVAYYQKRLRDIEHEIYTKRLPVVIVYEGWDAAGKGGNIKRLTKMLDPRGYEVVPIAAPNAVEKEHHYLWRFWKHLPKAGHIGIFDRSWYGRVMVERIEGFCTAIEYQRAYEEINEFEKSLADAGAIVLKFWLHIDKEEQMNRFQERAGRPEKAWKITDEDWRNREKWEAYQEAVGEMIEKTSKAHAPWIIVESNSKYYARIKVLKTVVEALEKELKKS